MLNVIKLDKTSERNNKTIKFLEGIIEDLKKGELDPEKCILITKWRIEGGSENYNIDINDLSTETVLGMLDMAKYSFMNDVINS